MNVNEPKRLVSYFCSGDALRSRSVSSLVLTDTLCVPAPPARLVADWQRDTSQWLATGSVEALPLPRARMRWPDYKHCVQAVCDWIQTLGLRLPLAHCDLALMACRAATYHHDGAQYGGMAFCNLFLSEDRGLDLHFPHANCRIPLQKGTVVLFDTGQPHGVIARTSSGFESANFLPERDYTQVFLTWELPLENADVSQALGVSLDVEFSACLLAPREGQVWLDGARVGVCPDSGCWQPYT